MGLADVIDESFTNFVKNKNIKIVNKQTKINIMKDNTVDVSNDAPTYKRMEESLNELCKALESFNMVLDEFTLCTVAEKNPEEDIAIVSLAGVWKATPGKIKDHTKTLYEHIDRLKNIFA